MNRSLSHERVDPLLVEQPRALMNYLDALLREVPTAADSGESAGAVVQLDRLPASKLPTQPVADAIDVAEVESDSPSDAGAGVGGLPAWAVGGFQALIFLVGNLRLSVPLVKLHSVIPWSDKVTSTPNKTDWCCGLLRYRDRNVTIVDTAKLVLPPGKRDAAGADAQPNHILIVGDGQWGLACHAIGEVLALEPAQVKWRSDRGHRRWLAGTVVEHLCALLDTEAFAAMLRGSR